MFPLPHGDVRPSRAFVCLLTAPSKPRGGLSALVCAGSHRHQFAVGGQTPVSVLLAVARHGGMGLMAVVRSKASTLSAKAQRLGLETREDVEKEFQEAKRGWSKGTEYHCPFCDKDFWSPSGARKHMKTQGHPVLRWDWY